MNIMEIFGKEKALIGMVHVRALPGTPNHQLSMKSIIELAVEEAKIYEQSGLDGIMIENMHDVPYLNRVVGPEIVSSMTAVAQKIRESVQLPIGIQILASANQEALAVAKIADLNFVRVEGFVFGHLADEGYTDACAGELLRYRKTLGAEHIALWTDIKKKHSSHAITSDISIGDTAKAAEFFLSDGLIITGNSTGKEPDIEEVKAVRKCSSLPVILGSGITPENIGLFYPLIDAAIVGSYFKKDGDWKNPLDQERIRRLKEQFSTASRS